MASVKRRLFTMLSAISLVLCLATAGLWVRSYWRESVYANSYGYPVCSLIRGGVVFSKPVPGSPRPQVTSSSCLLGFEFRRADVPIDLPQVPGEVGSAVHYYEMFSECLTVPYWFLCAIAAVLPAIWLRRYWRDRRVPSDGMPRCAKCEYNLTGNVSGICPECGTAIPAEVAGKSGV